VNSANTDIVRKIEPAIRFMASPFYLDFS